MDAKKEQAITYELASSFVTYNPIDGEFTYKTTEGKHRAGDIAGHIASLGYIIIYIAGIQIKAHRLAFLIVEKTWPLEEVDHRNRIRDDNRWVNLRKVTRSQNLHNKPIQEDNKSGYSGVYWSKAQQKWRAYIAVEGIRDWLYYGDSKEEAIKARKKAEHKYNLIRKE